MPPSKANQAQRISPDAGSGARTAKASKDSGSFGSKDSLEAYVQLLRAVSTYRQQWRVLVLLMVVVAFVAVGISVSLPWDTIEMTESYDPNVGLSLSLAG